MVHDISQISSSFLWKKHHIIALWVVLRWGEGEGEGYSLRTNSEPGFRFRSLDGIYDENIQIYEIRIFSASQFISSHALNIFSRRAVFFQAIYPRFFEFHS